MRAWRDRVDYTEGRLEFGETERSSGAEIAFAAKPVGEAEVEEIERNARADFDEAVGDREGVVKDRVVGEAAHGEVIEPVDGRGGEGSGVVVLDANFAGEHEDKYRTAGSLSPTFAQIGRMWATRLFQRPTVANPECRRFPLSFHALQRGPPLANVVSCL